MRHQPTEAEARLWRLLRGRRFVDFKFRRQVPLGAYIVDFLNYDTRLIIELDGGQHSENARDEQRDAWLRAQGFQILRIWNSDLFKNPESVLTAIHLALTEPTP